MSSSPATALSGARPRQRVFSACCGARYRHGSLHPRLLGEQRTTHQLQAGEPAAVRVLAALALLSWTGETRRVPCRPDPGGRSAVSGVRMAAALAGRSLRAPDRRKQAKGHGTGPPGGGSPPALAADSRAEERGHQRAGPSAQGGDQLRRRVMWLEAGWFTIVDRSGRGFAAMNGARAGAARSVISVGGDRQHGQGLQGLSHVPVALP